MTANKAGDDRPVLRNINPLGQVDLPLLYREGEPFDTPGRGCLEPGEGFAVSPEHAEILLQQAGNYEPVNPAAVEIDAAIPENAWRHREAGGATSQKTDGE